MTEIKTFEMLNCSTQTVIATSNMWYDIDSLVKLLPITEYTVVKTKRGRKKQIKEINPNDNIPIGSIVCVKNGKSIRGVEVHNRTKSKKKEKEIKNPTRVSNCFPHSITLIIVVENVPEIKWVNVKISRNEKMHLTGCKTQEQYILAVKWIFYHIYQIEKISGEKYMGINPIFDTLTHSRFIFNVVMKNIDNSAGFEIDRKKIDTFLNKYTSFSSTFEVSSNSVNIKKKKLCAHDNELVCLDIFNENESKVSKVNYTEFLKYHDNKQVKKIERKDKHHTLLLFSSGKYILSGSNTHELSSVFYEFHEILKNNRDVFEKKLDYTKLLDSDIKSVLDFQDI